MSKASEVKFKIECEWFEHSITMSKSSEYSSGVLSARLRKLEDHYEKLTAAYENLLNILTDENSTASYDARFKTATIQYNELDAISAKFPNSDGSYSTTESAVHSRLPVLDLDNFEGNVFEWFSFISLYNSLVLSRKDLSKTEKYHYLFSHVHKEPRTLIQHLPMTNESLDIALEILKSRYENKRMIIDRHLSRLINLPNVSNSQNLRVGMLNPLLESVMSLKNLGLTVDDYFLVYMCMSKLPIDLKTRFEQRYGGVKNDLPTFENFITFLQNECHFIDTTNHSASTATSAPTSANFGQPRKTNFTPREPNRLFDKIGCAFCNGQSHKITDCFKFQNMSRDDRRGFIKSKNLCFRCFGSHSAISCKRNVPCMYCNNTGHNEMICLFTTPRNENTNGKGKGKFESPSYKKSNHVSVGVIDNDCDRQNNNGFNDNVNRNENRCTRYERTYSSDRASQEGRRNRSESPLSVRRSPHTQ